MSELISREAAIAVVSLRPDRYTKVSSVYADRIRALPAVQPDAAAIREAALIEAAEMLDEKHRGDLPKHIPSESGNWVRALIRKGDKS